MRQSSVRVIFRDAQPALGTRAANSHNRDLGTFRWQLSEKPTPTAGALEEGWRQVMAPTRTSRPPGSGFGFWG